MNLGILTFPNYVIFGARWNQEALRFVASCAKSEARWAPALLRASARAAWHARWWGLLSIASQTKALALGRPAGSDDAPLADAMSFAIAGLAVSRFPLR